MQTRDDLGSFIRKAIYKASVKASVLIHPIFAVSRGIKAKMFYFCLISIACERILRTKVQ